MKKKYLIILSVVLSIVFLTIYYVITNQMYLNEQGRISNKDLKMVETYLNNKYDLNLVAMDGTYTNYEYGISGGLQYYFEFQNVNDLKISAVLRYDVLNRENLDNIILNITNPNKALEIKSCGRRHL